MYIEQKEAKYAINLDVSKEFPAQISVYHVETNGKKDDADPDDVLWGTITGPKAALERLQSNLLHEINENEAIKVIGEEQEGKEEEERKTKQNTGKASLRALGKNHRQNLGRISGNVAENNEKMSTLRRKCC